MDGDVVVIGCPDARDGSGPAGGAARFGPGPGARALEEILGSLVDGVSVHSSDGVFLYVSPAFERLVQRPRWSLLGRSVCDLELLHREDLPELVAAHERLLRSGGTLDVTYRVRGADGFRWMESRGGRGVGAHSSRLVVATREVDAPDRRGQVESLARRRWFAAELEELATQRRALLTTVAHRTRTPVTTILGFAETLRRAGPELCEERRQDITERLVAAARGLAEIVEHATETEALAAAGETVDGQAVDLRRLLREVAAGFADRDRPVEVEVDHGLAVLIDEAPFRRALSALVDNAFEHAEPGTPVWLRAWRGDGVVLIAVEDAGPGVPVAARTRIFEPFAQVGRDEPDPRSGLGLHLVAEVARVHGGRAWVQDRQGGGASFRIALPARRLLPATCAS